MVMIGVGIIATLLVIVYGMAFLITKNLRGVVKVLTIFISAAIIWLLISFGYLLVFGFEHFDNSTYTLTAMSKINPWPYIVGGLAFIVLLFKRAFEFLDNNM